MISWKLSVQTELGIIKTMNILSEEEIVIARNSVIPYISTVFTIKINNYEKDWKAIKEQVITTISKLLELTSFALAIENTWTYLKIYSGNHSQSFAYSEIKNTLPMTPTSHEMIDVSGLQHFLNKTYQNYNEKVNDKYNFCVALKWYLDSTSLRYDVMKFISASIAFESILDSAITDEKVMMDKNTFEMVMILLKKGRSR